MDMSNKFSNRRKSFNEFTVFHPHSVYRGTNKISVISALKTSYSASDYVTDLESDMQFTRKVPKGTAKNECAIPILWWDRIAMILIRDNDTPAQPHLFQEMGAARREPRGGEEPVMQITKCRSDVPDDVRGASRK